MLIAVTLLLGWCLLSLPLGVVVGRRLAGPQDVAAPTRTPGVSVVTAQPTSV